MSVVIAVPAVCSSKCTTWLGERISFQSLSLSLFSIFKMLVIYKWFLKQLPKAAVSLLRWRQSNLSFQSKLCFRKISEHSAAWSASVMPLECLKYSEQKHTCFQEPSPFSQQCSGSIYVTVARPLLLFVTENMLLWKTILSLFPPPFPQVFITQVCGTVESAPLNSDVQLAGLRLLTNMSVTSDYHQKMINSIPCFLHLLSEGTERTQVLGSVVFTSCLWSCFACLVS